MRCRVFPWALFAPKLRLCCYTTLRMVLKVIRRLHHQTSKKYAFMSLLCFRELSELIHSEWRKYCWLRLPLDKWLLLPIWLRSWKEEAWVYGCVLLRDVWNSPGFRFRDRVHRRFFDIVPILDLSILIVDRYPLFCGIAKYRAYFFYLFFILWALPSTRIFHMSLNTPFPGLPWTCFFIILKKFALQEVDQIRLIQERFEKKIRFRLGVIETLR